MELFQQQPVDHMVGFNYSPTVPDEMFNTNTHTFPMQPVSNMGLPQMHFSQAVPMGPFNAMEFSTHEIEVNNIPEIAEECTVGSEPFGENYDMETIQTESSTMDRFEEQKVETLDPGVLSTRSTQHDGNVPRNNRQNMKDSGLM